MADDSMYNEWASECWLCSVLHECTCGLVIVWCVMLCLGLHACVHGSDGMQCQCMFRMNDGT